MTGLMRFILIADAVVRKTSMDEQVRHTQCGAAVSSFLAENWHFVGGAGAAAVCDI